MSRCRKVQERDWTVGEVAAVVKVAGRTVTKWADHGGLRHYRLPVGRHRRFRAADVVKFLEARGVPVPPELLASATRAAAEEAAAPQPGAVAA